MCLYNVEKLNTVKFGTASPFTGVYIHYDKTNTLSVEEKNDYYNVKYNE